MTDFDVCITNPPYNGNEDLKILSRVIPRCKQTIAIHPCTWLLGLKKQKKFKQKYYDMVNGRIKSVEMFNGNRIFGIGLFTPVGIFDIRNVKQKTITVSYFGDEYTANTLDDITVYGEDWPVVSPLYENVKEYCENGNNINDHRIKKEEVDDSKYICQLAGITGDKELKSIMNMYKDSFYTMVLKDSDENKGIRISLENKKDNDLILYQFDTEEERDNFIEYLKTDFARFCLSFYKINFHLNSGELAIVPWLDFTKRYTDKDLYELFNVSEEQQRVIKDFLPDYYGIRND